MILCKKTLLITIFLCLLLELQAQDKILIIHSYSSDNNWVQSQTKGIKNILGNDYKYFQFFMNTKKIPKNQFALKAQEAITYYKKVKPDLVFITDDNALKLLGLALEKDTPLVFGGINGNIKKDYPWILESINITGVLERPLIKRSISQIKKALDIKGKALLILGDSPTAHSFYNEEFKRTGFTKRLDIDTYISGNFTNWKKTILSSKEKGYSMLMIAGNQAMRDKSNNHIDKNIISAWISKHSPLPTFTIHTKQIGKGLLIGGMVIKGELMGEEMGIIAKKILDIKIIPSRIKIHTQYKTYLIFSQSELEKKNLSISPSYEFPVTLFD